MKKENNWRNIRNRLCACSIFVAIITYILIGYFANVWTWSLFVFLIVPLSPFLLGLKKFRITYELMIIIIYLVIGFTTHLWHPFWVLFLTIPVYHILFDNYFRTKGSVDVDYIEVDENDEHNEK